MPEIRLFKRTKRTPGTQKTQAPERGHSGPQICRRGLARSRCAKPPSRIRLAALCISWFLNDELILQLNRMLEVGYFIGALKRRRSMSWFSDCGPLADSIVMHGLDNVFIQLANAITSVWRGRSALSRPSLFGDPEFERRSRFWLTLLAVVATLFAVALAAGAVYFLWWTFAIHERRGG
jgi:hypothetical protein